MATIERISDVFADAQNSSINHKSLTKRLRKIEAKHANNRSAFEDRVKECVIRSLEVAKAEKAGLNVVKFLCAYCSAAQNDDSEGQNNTNDDESEDSNITNQIIVAVLPYLTAKDKVVRYRATQIVSQLMGIIQEIEDDLYQLIRHGLGARVRDKVPAIRLEAVCALGRLLENELDEEAQAAEEKSKSQNGDNEDEEEDEDDDDEDDDMYSTDEDEPESNGLLDKLLDVLQNDTNADVRRALLMNLPVEPKTLPYLLERARDKDASVRRALYTKLMPNLGDFRHLSLSMREKLLRWGLRDRDERVRKAAARMFGVLWIDQIAKSRQQTEPDGPGPESKKKQVGFYDADIPALLELLERIDVINAGQENGIAPEAMREFWELRPDYFDLVDFNDVFWAELSAESAFLARTFYDYCSQNKEIQTKAEEGQKFPEVTRFGFHLQRELNKVLEMHGSASEEVDEEKVVEQEFIVEQLLHISHVLDYTDEIGRRKLFGLLRQVLSIPGLPDEVTKLTIDALRVTCTADAAGEKEFIAVVQEAVADVNDTLNDDQDDFEAQNNRGTSPADDESFVSAQSELSARSDRTVRQAPTKRDKRVAKMTPEEREAFEHREIMVQLKCLNIAHTLLQNITCEISSNVSLETMVNTLIIPAVRNMNVVIRERAVECLGLTCLLSASMYHNNRDLITFCVQKGDKDLKITCLQILNDCMITHNTTESMDLGPFVAAFKFDPEVQICATTCVAKLMMCGFYKPSTSTETQESVDLEDANHKSEMTEVFDNAIEEAISTGTKGSDLLAKVKAAIVADIQGKEALDQGKRRES